MSRSALLLLMLVLTTAAGARDNPDVSLDQSKAAGEISRPDGNETGTTGPIESGSLSPRARYNLALSRLAAGELATAATEFLAARDQAGPDPELRYRAAFNLGIALAGQADAQQADSPEQAIETLRNSAAWFNDAIRLAPAGDEDPRVNLEIVLRRIQQLADQLNQGNRLEARLDRIIDDQRGLRDSVRRLFAVVEAEGAAAEPVGFQREFEELASLERTLLAETGSIGDLAAEERALIDEKAGEQRSQQESLRAFQLQSLEHYLQQARQSLSDARRRLRRLEAERAHRRVDTALSELKRAREQLLDPVTVLKRIAQDEMSLLTHTQSLAVMSGGALRLVEGQATAAPPPWLTTEHLGQRQGDMAARTGEILARLEAGARTKASDAADPDPRQQRMLQAAREAVPFLQTAADAMRETQSALTGSALTSAVENETEALHALYRAIERFAGVRDVIELAFADQTKVVRLLTPGEDPPVSALSTQARTRAVSEAVDSNRDRLDRLEGLLQEELAAGEARGRQKSKSGDAAHIEAVRERYGVAEELRVKTVNALERLSQTLADLAQGAGSPQPLPPAAEGLQHLEALRRLFFSLLEHLQELLDEQTNTHDSTATLGLEVAMDKLAPRLGLVSERQGEHATTGDALAQALAQQADAAGANDKTQSNESNGQLAEAANEVRTASGLMHSAGTLLSDAVQRAASMSPALEPALTEQLAAMEHLENAMRLLKPPQQQPDQDAQQQQQQQQQEQEMSQRQALRRLQAIRDRESARQRRRAKEPLKPEPVEKDW